MPIFDAGSSAFQGPTVVGTATGGYKVWSGTYSSLASISPAVTVRDITIVNTGQTTVYLNTGGTIPAGTSQLGLALGAGQQLTVQGWTATTNTTTNDWWAICSNASANLGTVIAGLASNAWVV